MHEPRHLKFILVTPIDTDRPINAKQFARKLYARPLEGLLLSNKPLCSPPF